eukprot:8632452-Karenia_brevis.AAC.1
MIHMVHPNAHRHASGMSWSKALEGSWVLGVVIKINTGIFLQQMRTEAPKYPQTSPASSSSSSSSL